MKTVYLCASFALSYAVLASASATAGMANASRSAKAVKALNAGKTNKTVAAPAKLKPKRRSGGLTANYMPTTAQYKRSEINFNGLIKHETKRTSKLAKRVKTKMSAPRAPAASRNAKKQVKIARFDFDDVDVHMGDDRAAARAPKVASNPPAPMPAFSGSQPGSFQVVMKSKTVK